MSEQTWMTESYTSDSLRSNMPYSQLFNNMQTHADRLRRLSMVYSDALSQYIDDAEATHIDHPENQKSCRSRAEDLKRAADDITHDCEWLSKKGKDEMAMNQDHTRNWEDSINQCLSELETGAQTGIGDPEHLVTQRSTLQHASDAGLMLPIIARHRQTSAQRRIRSVADDFIARHHESGASQLSIPAPSTPWERRAEAHRLTGTFEKLPTSVRESNNGQIVASLLSATWVDRDPILERVQDALLKSIRSAAPRRPGQTEFEDRQSRFDTPQIDWRRRAKAYHKATKPSRKLLDFVKTCNIPPRVSHLWPEDSDADLHEIDEMSAGSEAACATRFQSGRKDTIEKFCRNSIRDHNNWLKHERARCSTSPHTVNTLLRTAQALQKLRQGNARDTLELLDRVELQLSEVSPETVVNRYTEADTHSSQSAKRDDYNAVGWHCDCAVSDDGRSMKCDIVNHTSEPTEIDPGSHDTTELNSEGDVLTFVRDVLQEALKEEEQTSERGKEHRRVDSGIETT